ncbi:MAG TPA: hypothetical protein VGC05_24810, partial [Mycobacterium sp.]
MTVLDPAVAVQHSPLSRLEPPDAVVSAPPQLVRVRPNRSSRRVLPRPLRRTFGPIAVVLLWYAASATGVLP